ncbi:hypothetical protein C1752_06594 [Acaryochloris thomasi RCC1774]|uniref:Uncharacterized protein n=1 Tax=Acaryochloris thomasi RCC1774 TaxID=1764569 RepID=A0A2W1JIE6_9CYAN|nr:hypothetical protein C1752_06594 [Acaryochloris thomasi RCC1774]
METRIVLVDFGKLGLVAVQVLIRTQNWLKLIYAKEELF